MHGESERQTSGIINRLVSFYNQDTQTNLAQNKIRFLFLIRLQPNSQFLHLPTVFARLPPSSSVFRSFPPVSARFHPFPPILACFLNIKKMLTAIIRIQDSRGLNIYTCQFDSSKSREIRYISQIFFNEEMRTVHQRGSHLKKNVKILAEE